MKTAGYPILGKLLGFITGHIMYWIVPLFLLLRMIQPESLPVFNDESIYLNWGKRLFDSAGGKFFVPVALDGKQMAVPFVYGLLGTSPFDPLILGRMFSALFSVLTLIFSLRIFDKVFSRKKPGILFRVLLALLIVFCPYLLFFDRMAMPDSVVAASFTVCVYLFLEFLKEPRKKTGIILAGMVLALGWWFKSTVLLFFPPAIILFILGLMKDKKSRFHLMINGFIMVAIFFLLILPLLLSEEYRKLPFMEGARINTVSQLLTQGMKVYLDKTIMIFFWFFNMTNPLLTAGLISSVVAIRKHKEIFSLLIFFLVPVLLEVFLVNISTSRYILFAVPVFLVLSIFGLSLIGKMGKFLAVTSLALTMVSGLTLVFNPIEYYQQMSRFPFVQADLSQYFTGWTSGWGIKETVDWIKKEGKNKQTFVFLGGVSGNPDDAVYVFFREKNFLVLPYPYIDRVIQETGKEKANYFFLSRGPYLAGLENRLSEITRFNKPLDNEYIGIYWIDK